MLARPLFRIIMAEQCSPFAELCHAKIKPTFECDTSNNLCIQMSEIISSGVNVHTSKPYPISISQLKSDLLPAPIETRTDRIHSNLKIYIINAANHML